MTMQEWVIFDLDGTLVESEQLWRDVRRDFVTANGGRWHDDAQKAMIGMRTEEWSHYLHDELAVPLDPTAIADRVVDEVVRRVSQRVPVLPGAGAALERCASAFRLGLATSATPIVAHTVLEKTGWAPLFAVVVSADEVGRGNPAPDVYLRALERLEADGSRTAAVEDSGNGIRAAHAAGLAVVAIPNRAYPPDEKTLALAERVLPNLDALDVTTIRDVLRKKSMSS
jgi:HAD superfamily hydrolase (TIGR01509 family)